MRSLLHAYFAYRTNPAHAVRQLVLQRRFGAAMWGYAVAALCWVCFFWIGDNLSAWGFVWRFIFFWLLEVSLGYLWASLSGLFLSFLSHENGSAALFIALGLSGFVQGLLLCYALIAAAAPWLHGAVGLVFMGTLILRFSFAVLTVARGAKVGLNKALGALCFVLVPAFAAFCLCIGTAALIASLAA